ncbi:hypothetical protein A2480_00730 [Candidatus Uhrbacteria bacterium RIFOXYC2_FULL_47_19]|uniref:Uncharacterized protein n=1 Tax=Candidatus Uhrbacteria bacterium RIFOXYC2_FULL_47_19 TaxID=1802424 RepID=A0A1F7WFP1_9BACT|nr:MAG: hypothetical protein A2480_00730 [Candidatus Uhrbacteria bacterium RIFOXYC2_FULL_47_19]
MRISERQATRRPEASGRVFEIGLEPGETLAALVAAVVRTVDQSSWETASVRPYKGGLIVGEPRRQYVLAIKAFGSSMAVLAAVCCPRPAEFVSWVRVVYEADRRARRSAEIEIDVSEFF